MRAARPGFLAPRSTRLVGQHVLLRPVGRRDGDELDRVPDDAAWDLLLRKPAGVGVEPGAWLADAMRGARRGTERCWTIRDRTSGQLLGSTRFLNMDLHHRRLEIGATWLLPEARGTVANAESKLLLLDHAFGDLGIDRVHVQADALNLRSRAAIEALGATYEGTMRRHIIRPDGTTRDTAVYSILVDEWPDLRPALVTRAMARGAGWRERPSSLLTPAQVALADAPTSTLPDAQLPVPA